MHILAQLDREALAHNEKPYVLSFFPSGEGTLPLPLAQLSDPAVQLTAFKRAEDTEEAYILRLFEPTGVARSTELSIPALGLRQTIDLQAFELKSFRLDVVDKTLHEVSLLER